jgi:OOP family OmpA-OmpF porin
MNWPKNSTAQRMIQKMSDSTDEQSEKSKSPDSQQPQDALNELRELLLKPIQAQLDDLQKRLDTPDLHAQDVSRVLPEAISLRSQRDKKIEMALEPITEKTIKSSIRRDRKALVDALFPVMGPAIRRAIASAIQGMIQSFNQILEHSLSFNGLKWRLEALRTQKSFAEVVLLHTLIYQVEQVFLIHRETGLVLQHVVTKTVSADDPDLVSSMLTAIKDFVQDSFGGPAEETLETLRVGERSVWIEQGPQAFLAAVIRGNPPLDLQNILKDALEEIHFRHRKAMISFEGDAAPFEGTRYILEDCLAAQFKKEKQKPAYLLWGGVALIAVLLGGWSLSSYLTHRRWSQYVSGLGDQPGIVITNVKKKDGKRHVYGLKDPLAPDPIAGLKTSGLPQDQVIFHWEPYYSLLPEFAHQRLRAALNPPETVRLEFKNGALHARGAALHQWIEASRNRVFSLPWIKAYDDSELLDIDRQLQPPQTVTLELKGDTLQAQGTASQQWLLKAQQKVKAISAISKFQYDQLINTDIARLMEIRQQIDRLALFFLAGSEDLVPGQQGAIDTLIMQLKELNTLAMAVGKGYQIKITGHSDSTGTDEFNMQISQRRAETILTILVSSGLKNENFVARGVGHTQPLRPETNLQDRSFNRTVTFKVNLR